MTNSSTDSFRHQRPRGGRRTARPRRRRGRRDPAAAERHDEGRELDHGHGREAERHGQPGEPVDHLVLRVRDDDELRHEDRVEGRRLGVAERRRLDDDLRASRPRRPTTTGSSPRTATGTTLGADQSFTTNGPPAVTTGAAQGVAVTSATLTGSVDPKGLTTNWHFDYGTTTSYGSKTPSKSAGNHTGAVAVSAALAGPRAGDDLPLPARRVELGGHDDRLRPDLRDSRRRHDHDVRVPRRRRATTSRSRASSRARSRASSSRSTASRSARRSNAQVATVLTGGGGTWSYAARPKIQTTYQAGANGATSTTVTIGVQPAVSLARITGARFATKVAGGELLRRQAGEVPAQVGRHTGSPCRRSG